LKQTSKNISTFAGGTGRAQPAIDTVLSCLTSNQSVDEVLLLLRHFSAVLSSSESDVVDACRDDVAEVKSALARSLKKDALHIILRCRAFEGIAADAARQLLTYLGTSL
jgi:hypothetical protein